MDDYLATLPPDSFGTPAGLTFIPASLDGMLSTGVLAGSLVRAALSRMRRDVASAVRRGQHVVVDDVMLGADDQADYRRLIPRAALAFVAIRAPLGVVEARERQRGDRTPGLARWQFDRVHAGCDYDMTVDTGSLSPDQAAVAILTTLGWFASGTGAPWTSKGE